MDLHTALADLADPTRVRLIALLARAELSVGQLHQACRLPQSTVSRQLNRLHREGWLIRRQVGTATLYRLAELDPIATSYWGLTRDHLDAGGLYAEDVRRMEHLLAEQRVSAAEFFGQVAERWDAERRELFGDAFVLPALLALSPAGAEVVDLGCGTGQTLAELLPVATRAVGIDREPRMLEIARSRVGEAAELLQGELHALPLDDDSVDAAVCMLVLHHVGDLGPALADIARALRPGGRLVIVDMIEHARDAARHRVDYPHLGFSEQALGTLAAEAGLAQQSWRVLPPDPDALGPGLFVAAYSA